MADISLSFNAEGGISLDDLVGIFTGTIDPSVTGETAPIGSIFVRQTGQLYQKVGPLSTDWNRFTQGLGEGVKITAQDSTSGYLNTKILVSNSLLKSISDLDGNESMTLDLANVGTAGTYTSVTTNAKGQIISGSNPGFLTQNQNIDVTGDATGSGSNSINLTLANSGVVAGSYKNANVTVDSKGRVTAASDAYLSAGSNVSLWKADTVNATAPADGFITWNDANPKLATTVSVSHLTNGINVSSYLTLLTAGNVLHIQDKNDATNYLRYRITAVNPRPSSVAFSVVLLDSSAAVNIANGQDLALMFSFVGTNATVTSVAVAQPAQGLTITGGPITTSGTFTFALANDLAAIESLSTTGIATRTATDTWAARTLTGTTNRINVGNGNGVSGNPTIDISPNYPGQSSISTLGVITTGNWQATTIATQFGGTGRTTIGSANQFLSVNNGGTALEYKTIQAGAGISVVPATQSLTIANTGVLSIVGLPGQISVSPAAGTGNVTLSLPQSIATNASPTFAQVLVASDPILPLQVATKQYVDQAVQGLNPKQSVRAATTANISISGLSAIDGIPLNTGDRILVKNQTSAQENGVYVAAQSSWTRAVDLDSWTEVPGAFIFVEEGITQADTAWVSTSDQGGTLDTTPINWVQFTSAADIIAGAGLTRTGNSLAITAVGTPGSYNNVTVNSLGQVTSGSNVAYLTGNQSITLTGDVTGTGANAITTTLSNTGVSAGTYKSVTVDTKGRVTSATNPTTLSGFGITDAQPLNAFLSSEAALTTDGIVIRSGNTALTRSIVAASSKIAITNGNGVAGDPTIDVNESNILINNTSGTLGVVKGGTGLTATGSANQVLTVSGAGGSLQYKTLAGSGVTITHAAATGTITIATINNGTVTSVGVTGSTGLSVTGSPITSSGTINIALSGELQSIASIPSTGLGILTRVGGANGYTTRSLVSGNGTLTLTNPIGTAGNFGIDLASAGTAGTYRSVTTDIYGRVTAGTNPTTLAGYQITDAVNSSQLGVAGGVATLDSNGKLNFSQIPASAISDTFVVATSTEQTALTAQVGDIAIRTDLNQSFILRAEPASTLSNWQELLTPTGGVTSVNGQTGAATVGTVRSINGSSASPGIVINGGGTLIDPTFSIGLAGDLAAIENIGTTGIAVRTAGNTWTTRSLVAGSGVSISNADGVSGNITISSAAVTSVGLALPSIFSVSNSPVTSSGTLTASLVAQPINTVLAGPTIGANAVPTFRTLGLATNDINDVTITSATPNQVLTYNGTRWVNSGAVGANAAGLVGAGQSGAAAWTLISGNTYRADFAHDLGTTNVVITVFDSSTNAVVLPDLITLTNANTVRIRVVGNTRTLKVVVVANGQSIVAGGSTPSSIVTSKDGVTVDTNATKLNFTGQAVNVVAAGGGTTNISFGARYSYFANSLDTPNNADFAVNSFAPVTTDPTFNSLNVRSFSNTVEQGVALTCSIPPNATQVTIKMRGRAQTAPGASAVVQPRLYSRQIPNNAAVNAWSGASELANIVIPTNTNFQYTTQTIQLSALGIFSDRLYQFEITRRVTGVTGTNLAANFLLAELTLEFA